MIHQISGAVTLQTKSSSEYGLSVTKKNSADEHKTYGAAYVIEVSESDNRNKDINGTEMSEIEGIKEQAEMTSASLKALVEKLILKQQDHQSYFSISIQILGGSGDIYTSQTEAQQAISETGEWGVNAVSDRIVDFAKAISGNDPGKLEELKDAIDRGFKSAGRAFGRDLPDICGQTYDAIMQKLDDWANTPEEDAVGS